jgi:hypothetical protein
MRRQGSGLIVNIGSIGGLAGIPFQDDHLERATQTMITGERKGARPEAVARLLERLMFTPRPRVRYTVGPAPERAAASIKRVLPSRLFERLLLPAYGLSARR